MRPDLKGILRLLTSLFVAIFVFVVGTESVEATCYLYNTGGPDPAQGEWCLPATGVALANGHSEFSCASYEVENSDPVVYEYQCYWNDYWCDTPCYVTGGTCPSECKSGTTCPPNYTSAAGCGAIDELHPNFGCKSNQSCCRAITCITASADAGGCCYNRVNPLQRI